VTVIAREVAEGLGSMKYAVVTVWAVRLILLTATILQVGGCGQLPPRIATGQPESGMSALAGHTVYASMRETTGRNAAQVEAAKQFATKNGIDLRTIELDVASQESAHQAIKTIVEKDGRFDVVIHNAGRMVFGAAEAFTPEQLLQVYDTNVLSTQRVNRAALPQLRKQRKGLVLWNWKHEHARWHPAVSFTLLRGQGCHGCARCQIRRRAESLGHRDLHHRSRCLHLRHQPRRPRRLAGRQGTSGRVRQRPLRTPRRRHYEGFRRYRLRRCRWGRCRQIDRQRGRHAFR